MESRLEHSRRLSCPPGGRRIIRLKWQRFRIHPLSLVDATIAFGRRDTGHTTNCIRYWKNDVFIHPIIFMREPGTGGSNASGTGAHIRMRGKLCESRCNALMMLPNCTINNQYTHSNNHFAEKRTMQGLFIHFIREGWIGIPHPDIFRWAPAWGWVRTRGCASSHPASLDK